MAHVIYVHDDSPITIRFWSWRSVAVRALYAVAPWVAGGITWVTLARLFGTAEAVFGTVIVAGTLLHLAQRYSTRLTLPEMVVGDSYVFNLQPEPAIEQYHAALERLDESPWIEQRKLWVLLWDYPFSVESALLSGIADCHLKCGRLRLSKEFLRQAIEVDAGNLLAIAALEEIELIEAASTREVATTRWPRPNRPLREKQRRWPRRVARA